LFRTNYTNFTIGGKFGNVTELYHVMELYVLHNELIILLLYTVAFDRKF